MTVFLALTCAALTTMNLVIERDPNPYAITAILACLGMAIWA